MKPDHVKKFEESISYPEYTEEDKKKGMNNKDLDFMTKNPMYYGVIDYLLFLSFSTFCLCHWIWSFTIHYNVYLF